MKNNAKSLLGLVLIAGLTWAVAGGIKSDKKTPAAIEKNAISASENDHCQRPTAECPKNMGAGEETSEVESNSMDGQGMHSAADCPKGAKCPKEMHDAKSGQCCRKHSGSESKSAHVHGTTGTPEGKPVEAVKAKEPAAK